MHLKQAAAQYSGAPLDASLETIMHDPAETVKMVQKARDVWLAEHKPTNADGQVERVSVHIGLLAAVGELAIILDILPLNRGEASAACATYR